jgi:hypothetical protein
MYDNNSNIVGEFKCPICTTNRPPPPAPLFRQPYSTLHPIPRHAIHLLYHSLWEALSSSVAAKAVQHTYTYKYIHTYIHTGEREYEVFKDIRRRQGCDYDRGEGGRE